MLLRANDLIAESFLGVIAVKAAAAVIEPRISGVFETEFANPWPSFSSASEKAHEPSDEIKVGSAFETCIWVNVRCYPVLAIHAKWKLCNHLSGA